MSDVGTGAVTEGRKATHDGGFVGRALQFHDVLSSRLSTEGLDVKLGGPGGGCRHDGAGEKSEGNDTSESHCRDEEDRWGRLKVSGDS